MTRHRANRPLRHGNGAPTLSPMQTPRPRPDPVGPGQESVWDYPRPAIAVPFAGHVRIILAGQVIAETTHAVRTLETSHPPTYYLPPDSIVPGVLVRAEGSSLCEWKGQATY